MEDHVKGMEENVMSVVKKTKRWIKDGEEVCHKENLTLVMYVERIVRRTVSYNDGEKEVKKDKVVGVDVHWWTQDTETGKSELQKARFHTNELVPADVAKLGREAVIKWIESDK